MAVEVNILMIYLTYKIIPTNNDIKISLNAIDKYKKNILAKQFSYKTIQLLEYVKLAS